jgi:hypothetical protein
MSYNKEEANRLDAIEVLGQVIELAEQAKYQLAEYTTTKDTNLAKLIELARTAKTLADSFEELKADRAFITDHFKIITV